MQASDRILVGPPDRQPPRRLRRGGKSGLHRESCRLTAGGPFSKAVHGKCHRNIPPGFGRVRVKWCGKSAPRPERFGWQGKPHEEQDQIGDKRRPVAFEFRVGCMSPAVMPDLVEWLPPWSTKAQKPAYRPADPKCYILNLSTCGTSSGLDASCNPATAQIESGCLQTPTPCGTHPGPHPGLTHTNPADNLKQV